MSRNAQRRIVGGFIAAALFAVAVVLATYHVVRQSAEAQGWTAHAGIVLSGLTRLSTLFTESDIEWRYLAMDGGDGNPEKLASSRDAVRKQLRRLKIDTQDNERQQANLLTVEGAISRRFEFIDQMIDVRQREGLMRAMEFWRERRALRLLAEAEGSIKRAETEETRLLTERIAQSQAGMRKTIALICFLVLTSFSLMAVVFYATIRFVRQRHKVIQTLTEANQQLELKLTVRKGRSESELITETREILRSALVSVSGEHQFT